MSEIERYEEQPSHEVVRVDGELVTRADLRNAATDSWTSVLAEVGELSSVIAQSDMVPKAIQGNTPATAARILYGREVGLGPMNALTQLHNVEGRVGMSAEAMRALVLQHGHEIHIVESTSATVTLAGRRKGTDIWSRVTWTMDDAKRAKLTGKFNWTAYPRQMLLARATAELCRMIFPDVIHGLAAVEEFDDVMVVPGQAPAIEEGSAAPAKRAAKKTVSRAKKPAAETAKAPAPELPESNENVSADPRPAEPPAPEAPELPEPRGGGAGSGEAPAPPPVPELNEQESAHAEEPAAPAPEPGITAGQTRMLVARFNTLDVKDRAERLWICQQLIGREIESSKDMTKREASSVIDTLAPCESREDLENVLQATAAHQEQNGADE
ncbi:hypothetical protein [uncultured Aeromicrobium sp.]|uniref:hypothetical protein n=1 Tax=uncultured Aeromicrobium sp. TaxID=337820 RepID=UPI0025DF13C5|nr:hypothetical protein [uncultured Aeromicrobium sp.]